jgi:hypothetical protein
VSESAPSSLPHVTTPPRQETVNLARASSYFPQADLVQIPVSTQVYRGAPEPAHVPISGSFQYDPDHLNHDSQADSEDIFSLTNNPCQSYGRYDPSYHLLPPFSSTASSGLEHGVEPYQWLDQNAQYLSILQSYISNASSTFPGNPGNSDNNNDIYAEFRSTAMTSANDGTLPFPNYDANNLHYYTGM